MTTTGSTHPVGDTPAAEQLARARADLAKATTAVKLAATKRARLAAEVRALEAEAELEILRPQARADRERAEAAEAAPATNGYSTTATPHEPNFARTILTAMEPSGPAEPEPVSDRQATPGNAQSAPE